MGSAGAVVCVDSLLANLGRLCLVVSERERESSGWGCKSRFDGDRERDQMREAMIKCDWFSYFRI